MIFRVVSAFARQLPVGRWTNPQLNIMYADWAGKSGAPSLSPQMLSRQLTAQHVQRWTDGRSRGFDITEAWKQEREAARVETEARAIREAAQG